MDCDKDNVCRRQSCEKGRKEMSGDKHKQRLAQQRGGEEETGKEKHASYEEEQIRTK